MHSILKTKILKEWKALVFKHGVQTLKHYIASGFADRSNSAFIKWMCLQRSSIEVPLPPSFQLCTSVEKKSHCAEFLVSPNSVKTDWKYNRMQKKSIINTDPWPSGKAGGDQWRGTKAKAPASPFPPPLCFNSSSELFKYKKTFDTAHTKWGLPWQEILHAKYNTLKTQISGTISVCVMKTILQPLPSAWSAYKISFRLRGLEAI